MHWKYLGRSEVSFIERPGIYYTLSRESFIRGFLLCNVLTIKPVGLTVFHCIMDVLFYPKDLTRQYKTMQAQLESKVEFLEAQVRRLQKTLGEK